MIYIDEKHRAIIKNILDKFPYQFYAFGSRVQGTYKPFSDLDICCMSDLNESEKSKLSTEFEESNLPFKVDLIEWNKISTDFQNMIRTDLILIE